MCWGWSVTQALEYWVLLPWPLQQCSAWGPPGLYLGIFRGLCDARAWSSIRHWYPVPSQPLYFSLASPHSKSWLAAWFFVVVVHLFLFNFLWESAFSLGNVWCLLCDMCILMFAFNNTIVDIYVDTLFHFSQGDISILRLILQVIMWHWKLCTLLKVTLIRSQPRDILTFRFQNTSGANSHFSIPWP